MKFAWIVALAVAVGAVAAEDQAVQDKKDVEALIRDIYSKKIRELEYPAGKDSAPFRKRCEYLRSIFEAPLLKNDRRGCDVEISLYFRFPSLSDQEMSDLDDDNKLPKSRIVESSVKGATAVVKVQAPIGKDFIPTRIVYFLKKTDGRWRIHNMLAYDEWPLDTNREGGCKDASGYYHFALPAQSEADLEDLPPLCRALELHSLRQRTQGK